MQALSAGELTKRNVETINAMQRAAEESRSAGERAADQFATVVGSWNFIIVQSVILIIWVMLNIIGGFSHWDAYPFILLNLMLSFQAAYASPIIMMSQNRQAKLSDRRNELDLQINLLAEQENTEMLKLLRQICEKLEISLKDQGEIEAFEEATQPDRLIEQIKKCGEP